VSELAVHPVAALFPILAADELEELGRISKSAGFAFRSSAIRKARRSSMGATV
jgi:hypothetical protein